MLPSDLLVARVRAGKIRPVYANLDPPTLGLAASVVDAYARGLGSRKKLLKESLRRIEDEVLESYDFRLVRGLSALLERRCVFQPQGRIAARDARAAAFEEAGKVGVVTLEQRDLVMADVAARFGVDRETVEQALFSDLDDQLILREFDQAEPLALLRQYNLSLTQTLLFKSLRLEFAASGNWKAIFRRIKRLGLIYLIESGRASDGTFLISLDGPLSIFKQTDRYGTALAKLVPVLLASEHWRIKAEILARSKAKVYSWEASSDDLSGLVGGSERPGADISAASSYDSSVEARFGAAFKSLNSGWTLRREPEPLVAGTHVMIPDFSFERGGMKVYLEIVGFWTREYLERKIEKLREVVASDAGAELDMLIAADEKLACSKLDRVRGESTRVIYYARDVPLKPILAHLRRREESLLAKESGTLVIDEGILEGDVVNVESIAERLSVSVESTRRALRDATLERYTRIGESLVSKKLLAELASELRAVEKFTDAVALLESHRVREAERVLGHLGYAVVWEGIDMDRARIEKRVEQNDPAASE